MFLDELTPVVKELAAQPLAFLGGFFTGLFHLNLSEAPVKSWLDKQAGTSSNYPPNPSGGNHNGKSSGPQSISIE